MMKKTKFKPKKAVVRRFKVTGSGKILRRRGFARHLKAGKSRKRLRRLKRAVEVNGVLGKKIRQTLGIG